MELSELYNQLASSPSTISTEDLLSVTKILNNIPMSHMDNIFMLILHHYSLNNGQKISYIGNFNFNDDGALKTLIPNLNNLGIYGLKFNSVGKGLSFKLDNMPPDLQKIIVGYLSR
jgi:hypothetical protein